MEMTWKERLYRSLPFALVLVAATGIAVTEEIYYAIVALAGVWLLPSPLTAPANVSRETPGRDSPKDESFDEFRARINAAGNVSRETSTRPNVCDECRYKHAPDEPHRMDTLKIREDKESDLPLPCTLMHGSADDHVLGCEGWTFPR